MEMAELVTLRQAPFKSGRRFVKSPSPQQYDTATNLSDALARGISLRSNMISLLSAVEE
jgi:hypothetical protein